MVLKIEDCIWERDEKGELIPQLVNTYEKINNKEEKVKVIPLTRGERKKLMSKLDDKGDTSIDSDKELVLKHVIEPKFTEETMEFTEFGLIENLAMTVLQASGLPVGKNKTVKKANEKVETDFQKA